MFLLNRAVRLVSCAVGMVLTATPAYALDLLWDVVPGGQTKAVGATVSLSGTSSVGLDLMLVLDESGSALGADFTTQKSAAVDIVNSQLFGPNATATGVVLYATNSRTLLNLNQAKATVVNSLNAAIALGGSSCISCGIDAATANIGGFGRADAQKAMVVFLDGPQNIGATIDSAVATAENAGIARWVVRLPDGLLADAQAISSNGPSGDLLWTIGSVNELIGFINALDLAHVQVTMPDASIVPLNAGAFTVPDWIVQPGDNTFTVRLKGVDGFTYESSITITGVPEPSTAVIAAMAAAVGFVRRRRRGKARPGA
jgi:hypothetical protein